MNSFIRIFDSKKFEFCAMMRGQGKSNRFLKAFINSVRDTSPELIHACPYFGVQKITNISISRTFLGIIPVGIYKVAIAVNVVEKGKTNIQFKVQLEILQ
jgi:hypothetical protein